ncbi:MAG: class I SAM-dependent methyltransferase [Gammaproteobacteria bacterium]|nr:class I SAM-dependent methyltransferase [Gammaproteobacteria bacterium]MCP4090464.1 class I SAM-dependent methyltransferase [Gammaproteobacteria bacterium]MCP4276671.1 class I SAM-dependent methyltransferase [Gammaproteobacteria bacterium]MCP4831421.1 class I SAM-dependent methyltransferase [Gammaproteobacteria bacterium]MCP4927965.1 class I SAM-dependent methyltransferase [Gammaproteobacteria bacterium]
MADSSSWQDMGRVIRESIGLLGFWMTLRYLLIYMLSYKPFNDRSFDRRHGTNTGGMVPTSELDIDDQSTKWQSNLYLGSPARVTRHLIRSLNIDCSNYTFVDYGSGKGRVLFTAAEFPFRKVVGVEISRALHKSAERNLISYVGEALKSSIELWCGDARKYTLADDNLVLFMYHPFGPDILKEMLIHIQAAGEQNPERRILIPYLFSIGVSKAVFQEFPAFKLMRDELCVNNLYRWTLYELKTQQD